MVKQYECKDCKHKFEGDPFTCGAYCPMCKGSVVERNPAYDQFDAEKARYLKDNGYCPIDKDAAQELMDKKPWYIDTEVIKLKDWAFFKRVQGEIIPYSTKYLKEKTPEELRRGFARMIGVSKPDYDIFQSLVVLELKDGDTIVVKSQQVLSSDHRDAIAKCIGDMFKDRNVKVLVLDDGMDIGVIRTKEGVVVDET